MKKFNELNQINVSDKIEKKEGLSYLSWSYAWQELKNNFADANYKVYENQDGLPYFKSTEGYMVKVGVFAGGIEHISYLPVMNGANKAMKETSYKYTTKYGEKSVEACDMMAINKTIQRALVKAIALHGIGLYIYSGEDMPESDKDVKDYSKKYDNIFPEETNYAPTKNKASQKQIELLKKHNIQINAETITMDEASKLIQSKIFKKG